MATNLVYRPADPAIALPFLACVHWPRSGHHLVVRLLTSILGERFGYCSFYGEAEGAACCKSFPCRRPGISFAKQHDFDFDCELPAGFPLVVQYRRFDESLISSFEVRISEGSMEDTAKAFQHFARKRADLYRRFVDRWVRREIENRYILTYGDLVEEPRQCLTEILRLYGAEEYADRIDAAVESADHVTRKHGKRVIQRTKGVVNQTRVEAFRHYDKAFFADIEDCLDTPASAT